MDRVERKALRDEASRLFAENLKRLRNERGMEPVDLARKAGLHATHIGYLEGGKWTDERLGDLAGRTEAGSVEVRAEGRDLRDEMNRRFTSLEARLGRRFDLMLGAMITGLIGSIITHFLG